MGMLRVAARELTFAMKTLRKNRKLIRGTDREGRGWNELAR